MGKDNTIVSTCILSTPNKSFWKGQIRLPSFAFLRTSPAETLNPSLQEFLLSDFIVAAMASVLKFGLGFLEKKFTAWEVAQSCILLFFLLARPEMIGKSAANSSSVSEGYPFQHEPAGLLSYLAAQGHRNQGFEKTGYLKPHGVSVSTLKFCNFGIYYNPF